LIIVKIEPTIKIIGPELKLANSTNKKLENADKAIKGNINVYIYLPFYIPNTFIVNGPNIEK
jgi:hypothetical protein